MQCSKGMNKCCVATNLKNSVTEKQHDLEKISSQLLQSLCQKYSTLNDNITFKVEGKNTSFLIYKKAL